MFYPDHPDGMFRVGTMAKPGGDGDGAVQPLRRLAVHDVGEAGVIDHDRLAELRELEAESAPGLVAALFHSFLSRAPEDLGSLARAAERGDATVMGDVCHRLRGTMLTIGATAAAEACAALESAAAAGRPDLYPVLVERLRLECARVSAAVDAWSSP